MKLPEITEIKRLDIRPGDRLVLRTSDHVITPEQAAELRKRVATALLLPEDIPVVVIGAEWDVEVIGDGT